MGIVKQNNMRELGENDQTDSHYSHIIEFDR